jgi:hypothetical protein
VRRLWLCFVTPNLFIRNGGNRAMSPFVQAASNSRAQSMPLFTNSLSVNMACCAPHVQCRKIYTTEPPEYSIVSDASTCSHYFLFRAKLRYTAGFTASRLSETGSGADMLASGFLSCFSLAHQLRERLRFRSQVKKAIA